MSWVASIMDWRAVILSSGATESSKSRLTTSASLTAIFSKIAGREPGPKSWQRFGRAGAAGWMRKLIRETFLRLELRDRYNLARRRSRLFCRCSIARGFFPELPADEAIIFDK